MLVNELADMLKNVALASPALAFPLIVLPFPGGPNRRRPGPRERQPLKRQAQQRTYNHLSDIFWHATSQLQYHSSEHWDPCPLFHCSHAR